MDRTSFTPRWRRACAVALIATLAATAACTSADEPETEPSGSGPRPSPEAVPSATPSPDVRPAFELDVDLRRVRADGVDSDLRPRDLREPARAVSAAVGELYTAGFVDPGAWDDGAFPTVPRMFAGSARDRVAEDLRLLTLGAAARSLEAVRPRPLRVDVRFLADAKDRPVVAVADARFEGVGIEGEDRRGVRHDGQYTLRKLNGRWRIVAYRVRARTIEQRGAAAFAPGLPSLEPTFVLVIGSDARPGQPVAGTRADSIHIVGVNPKKGKASVIGIPRDSWVPIAGGGSDKINAALVRGGPQAMVQTVERLTGIDIDAYVLTGFKGFVDVVGAVGGIDITIPFAISDRWSHAQFRKGREHLTGNQALRFSRARHALSNGDFGRSLNQGRVIVAALATLRRRLLDRGSIALLPWAAAGARYLQSNLSLVDMFELLVAAPAIDPAKVRNEVATGRVGTVGGRSVVFLDGGAYARFRDMARDGILGT